MRRCCICQSEVTQEDAPILFVGKSGDYKELCEKCATKIESINTVAPDMEKSIEYVREKCKKMPNNEVKSYVEKMIGDITEVTEEKNSLDTYTSRTSATNIWIMGLKFFAWITFAIIVISGMVVCGIVGNVTNVGMGFITFLAFLAVAFLSVSGVMIFLGMAENLEEIKNILSKKK